LGTDYDRFRNPEKRRIYKHRYNKWYKQTHTEDREKVRERTKRLRARHKMMAIKFLGGKCEKCGYEKNCAALVFHHPDNVKKEPVNSVMGCKWEHIKEAIRYCNLLCANCHRELHHPELDMDNVKNEIKQEKLNQTVQFVLKTLGIL